MLWFLKQLLAHSAVIFYIQVMSLLLKQLLADSVVFFLIQFNRPGVELMVCCGYS